MKPLLGQYSRSSEALPVQPSNVTVRRWTDEELGKVYINRLDRCLASTCFPETIEATQQTGHMLAIVSVHLFGSFLVL